MAKPVVMVVDDDPEIRDQMRWALDETHVVHLAASSREAMAIMKRERPPLVTLDLGLPPHPAEAVEGLALLDQLLAVDRLARVIFLPANTDAGTAIAGFHGGPTTLVQQQ